MNLPAAGSYFWVVGAEILAPDEETQDQLARDLLVRLDTELKGMPTLRTTASSYKNHLCELCVSFFC